MNKSVINYKYSAHELTDEELLTEEELFLLTEETEALIIKVCSNITVKNQLRNPHSLILKHQEDMKIRKQKEKEFRENSFLFNKYTSRDTHYTNFS